MIILIQQQLTDVNRVKKIVICLILLCAALVGGTAVNAQEQAAENIASKCSFSATSKKNRLSRLSDKGLAAAFEFSDAGEQHVIIDLAGNRAQGVYIKWNKPCKNWLLSIDRGDGFEEAQKRGENGFVQEYIPLPDGTQRIKLETPDAEKYPFGILETEIYGEGALPASVHLWNRTPTNAELLVVSAHQDDELIFFGGTIPYYVMEKKYDTCVVYMAYENGNRLQEALEGLWVCGLRNHPVFLCYKDRYCDTLKSAKKKWDETQVTQVLTDIVLEKKPQVIVSHDENGEYGHGQHMMTTYCLEKAIDAAAAQGYSVPKCYLHMYSKNKVEMVWRNMPIACMNGESALSIAQDGLMKHRSQTKNGYRVRDYTRTSCNLFGLYRSDVGADEAKNDFFEHIALRIADKTPPENPNVSKVPGFSRLYQYTDAATGEGTLVRYGTVSGSDGWFMADATGALMLPKQEVCCFVDVTPTDLGETIVKSAAPLIYEYRPESDSEPVLLRFSSDGWHRTENGKATGELLEPALSYPEEPAPASPSPTDTVRPDETENKSSPSVFVLPLAALLIAAAVFVIIRKKKVLSE